MATIQYWTPQRWDSFHNVQKAVIEVGFPKVTEKCSINPALQINIVPLLVTMNKKIKRTTGQINFFTVTIKQQIKLVLRHSLCKWIQRIGSSVAAVQFHLQYFPSSQITHNNIWLHLLTRTTNVYFFCTNR